MQANIVNKRALSLAACCLFLVTFPATSADAEVTVEGAILLGSDYAFRGVSQTRSQTNVQAALSVSHSSGLFTDLWLSSVAFEPGDGVDMEIDFTVGYGAALSSQWSSSIAVVSYVFPGAVAGTDYDYSEIVAMLDYRGTLAASVAWSPDAFAAGVPASNWELAGSFPWAGGTVLKLVYGYADVDRVYGDDYAYLSAGLEKQKGSVAIELVWHHSSESASRMFGEEVAGSRLVLAAGFGF